MILEIKNIIFLSS